MQQLNRIRDSVRFEDALDAMLSNIPNRKYREPTECKHPSCKYMVSNGTTYCGNHISNLSMIDLLGELAVNRHLRNSSVINRRVSVRKNLYYRYRVHMNNGQRSDFDQLITSFRLRGEMPSLCLGMPYWSAERPDPILVKRSFTNQLHATKYELLDVMYEYLVDNNQQVNTETFDDLFFNINDWYPGDDFIPLDVTLWIRMQHRMSDYMTAYANFVDTDIAALEDGEIPTPIDQRESFEWYAPPANVYGASLLLHDAFQKKIMLHRATRIQLDTTIYIVDECPVCCEKTKLGKLPKCTHHMCQGCWDKWTIAAVGTAHGTCPICRKKQC